MTLVDASVLLAVFCCAAIVQGIAGMGFGMVTVPVLSLVMGSAEGVLWSNIAGLMSAASLAWVYRKNIEWKRYGLMIAGCLPAVVVTSWLLSFLNRAYMDVTVGTVMVAMVTFSVVAMKFPPVAGPVPVVVTGAVAGALSASVAQAGPAFAAYAQASRWEQLKFVATLQPVFLTMNLFVVPSKLIAGVGNVQHLTVGFLAAAACAIGLGAFSARFFARHIPSRYARYAALGIGGIGAVLILWRGVSTLM